MLSSGTVGPSNASAGVLSFCSSYRFSSSDCTFFSMNSSWLGVRFEGSAIREEGKFLKILGTRVFRGLKSEGRGNERVLEFGVEVG